MSGFNPMGALATPNSADHEPLAVAYSAGRDSTALLYATLQVACQHQFKVLALHVHHGLSAHADGWAAQAQKQCNHWASQGLPVQLLVHRITTKPSNGQSIEAWARRVRYEALSAMAQKHGVTTIMLAHHERDQAETFLLQAFRGSGVAGLSSMPRTIDRLGITWLRPWLGQTREKIEHYVQQHQLAYVDDDSNENTRFDRNRLRHQIWPALIQAFPQAQASLGAAARWAQEATTCLQEIAEQDLLIVANERGLVLTQWLLLSHTRRSNVLRFWIKQQTGAAAKATLITRMQHELLSTTSASWQTDHGVLRLHKGCLSFSSSLTQKSSASPETFLCILKAGRYSLPGWGGILHAQRTKAQGTPLAWLAHLTLRARQGGERFQAELGRPPRSLKKQYQDANIPAWERAGPLLYSGGQLLFVPGLGIDARMIALPEQAQMQLTWQAKI
jgi:tRNA(Ile)-lysidine synthase